MDIRKLYKDYGVKFVTQGHKHTREGWVNTPCPYCVGNFGYHLGFNEEDEYFVCWRCGGHSKWKTFSLLLKLPIHEVNNVLAKYSSVYIPKKTNKDITPVLKKLKLPSNLSDDLSTVHKKYLKSRGYNPDELKSYWGIKSTNIGSFVDNINFSWRIFVPIFWKGEMVSYLARSVNKDNGLRYLVCPEKREIVNIKRTIYGKEDEWTDTAVLVEGVTDVWKLGSLAVAVYGIKYKPEQVNILGNTFKRIFIAFDPDPQAQIQAKKLQAELNFRGVDTYNLELETDPGDMTNDEAKMFIDNLKTYRKK